MRACVADCDKFAQSPSRNRAIETAIDRASFMPGVLPAVRRVPDLTESPVIGLEHLLF